MQLWPIAVHWFINGWLLPGVIPQGESSYCPGSHGRLVLDANVETSVSDDGAFTVRFGCDGEYTAQFPSKPPGLSLIGNPLGDPPVNIVVVIQTDDAFEVAFLEGVDAIDARDRALAFITDMFLLELGGPDQAMEYVRFAIQMHPGLRNLATCLEAVNKMLGIGHDHAA